MRVQSSPVANLARVNGCTDNGGITHVLRIKRAASRRERFRPDRRSVCRRNAVLSANLDVLPSWVDPEHAEPDPRQVRTGPHRLRGAVIAGTGRRSLHASCRAVDFHAPAGKRAAVIAWLRTNHKGGLGIYSCGMSHLHIDNGGNYTWNKCVGGGRRRVAHAN